MRVLLRPLLCALGAWGLLSLQASAQTLGVFDPIIVCVDEIGEKVKAQGGCESGGNLNDAMIGHAETAAVLWSEIYSAKANIQTSRAGQHDILSPAGTDGKTLSPVSARRLMRAETPIFSDPETGLIYFVNPEEYPGTKPLYSDRAEIGFERAIGLSLLTAYPNIRKVLSAQSPPSHIEAASESLANMMSLGAHQGEPLPGVSLSRNFTKSLFETSSDSGGWGAAEFWTSAYKATNSLGNERIPLPEYFKILVEALNITAAQPSDTRTFYDGLDTVFEGFGWDRFPADGFSSAYAAAMARHHLDEKAFISPELEVRLKAEPITSEDVGRRKIDPLATDFVNLEIAGALLRETEVRITLCEDENDTCIPSDAIRLLVEGHVVDNRAGAKSFQTRRGDMVKILDGNIVQLTLPGRREAFDLNDKQFFSLKLGVANVIDDEALNYRLIIDMAVREASCTWDVMASTLNPWWRGDLDSPQALIPNDPDIPAPFKMELSQELREGWYLTQQSYWDDIGYEGQVFDGHLTEVKLRSLSGDAYDVVVPLAYQTKPQDKSAQARAFRQLMPSAASVKLRGAINDGGTVCVSPIAVAEMPDFMDMANASEADILAEMGLPPELLDIGENGMGGDMDSAAMAQAMAAILAGQMGAEEDMINDARDVMLQIYTPNLFTQQLGMLFPGQSLPLVHAGFGGWTPNAGFNIYVRLPGTAALDLEPGRYEAEGLVVPKFAQADSSESDDIAAIPPFYVWGERDGETINWRNYRAQSLRGTLTIKKQVAGAAIASLTLSGQTYEEQSGHPCNRENDVAPPEVCTAPNAGLEDKGRTSITIDRMFLLGVSHGEPLPVQNLFNLTTTRIPNPKTRMFE